MGIRNKKMSFWNNYFPATVILSEVAAATESKDLRLVGRPTCRHVGRCGLSPAFAAARLPPLLMRGQGAFRTRTDGRLVGRIGPTDHLTSPTLPKAGDRLASLARSEAGGRSGNGPQQCLGPFGRSGGDPSLRRASVQDDTRGCPFPPPPLRCWYYVDPTRAFFVTLPL